MWAARFLKFRQVSTPKATAWLLEKAFLATYCLEQQQFLQSRTREEHHPNLATGCLDDVSTAAPVPSRVSVFAHPFAHRVQ